MTVKGSKWGWLCALALPFAAHAQVDLTALDRDMAGPRAQVLVLGSKHLSQLPAGFDPKTLAPVLDRLAAFRPDIITIEALSGEECDLMFRHSTVYPPDYCATTDIAKAATGLDVPTAIAEVNAMLKAWPKQPLPAQRRKLASRFLAANDRASAYVQWLQLPAAERRAGDGLDDALVGVLQKVGTRNDEGYQIGAVLAARLGLQRVHAVDNHTGDNVQVTDVATFARQLQGAWDSDRAAMDAVEKHEQALLRERDLLPLYRYINQPDTLRVGAEMNIVPSLRAGAPERYPQMWVGGWEIRNLRMVANIRETFRERPDARVLSIVGTSHKPWFDGWLGQLQGVEIVDVEQVLK